MRSLTASPVLFRERGQGEANVLNERMKTRESKDLTEFARFWFRSRFAGCRRLSAKTCSVPAEIANRRDGDVQSFRAQERALQLEVSAITAQFARGGDDSMTRNVRPAALPHDVANRPRGAWPSRRFRHIAVGGDMSHGNSSNDRQDGPGEWRQFLQNSTRRPTPPCNPPALIARLRPSTALRSMSARV